MIMHVWSGMFCYVRYVRKEGFLNMVILYLYTICIYISVAFQSLITTTL